MSTPAVSAAGRPSTVSRTGRPSRRPRPPAPGATRRRAGRERRGLVAAQHAEQAAICRALRPRAARARSRSGRGPVRGRGAVGCLGLHHDHVRSRGRRCRAARAPRAGARWPSRRGPATSGSAFLASSARARSRRRTDVVCAQVRADEAGGSMRAGRVVMTRGRCRDPGRADQGARARSKNTVQRPSAAGAVATFAREPTGRGR